MIRTIFAAPDSAGAAEQLDAAAERLEPHFPHVAAMLRDAAAELTALAAFPPAHWRKSLEQQPAPAGDQGDQAPHRRGRHLP